MGEKSRRNELLITLADINNLIETLFYKIQQRQLLTKIKKENRRKA